ncbi:hypothetical protein CNMCM6106_004223 [Aspergillus hiratsukae]|uniref:Uncharacterized protein n=1 Tax=Aspergillus hiratsukae TaxID=1194566 RepID=A0A8H6QC38_9EURO|nr:hypothetical protein CNMCM6106_004223 [Aspergillus hiratsukae]
MSASNPNCPNGDRTNFSYDDIQKCSDGFTTKCAFTAANGAKGLVTDRWTIVSSMMFTVRRSVVIEAAPPAAGLRFGLHLQPAFPEGVNFNDLQYYAPNACYNLNDLNEDGVCDYLDSQVLSYRDDRLNALSVLAYHPQRQLALSLSRIDTPKYDDEPIRRKGQLAFLQDTDIGALGFQPSGSAINNAMLTAHYPFVERDRCNALLVQDRVPWGAFRPVHAGDSFSVAYAVRMYHSSSPHDAVWTLIKEQIGVLCPKPVCLDRPEDEISRLRLETLAQYFKEDPTGGAGFVTNCHPQNGQQLGNIVQYGFTGQNIMNAANILHAPTSWQLDRQQAFKVIDFYVSCALESAHGFTHGLYNIDQQRRDSWWTGLLLPLAYAKPGEDLEGLMGPLHGHLQTVIESLSRTHGVYTRCVLEETEALLSLYQSLNDAPKSWLEVVTRFGEFLLNAQEPDGSWFRAYSLAGEPLTEPQTWFGQTLYQQRSSTATVIPLLLDLARITKKDAYREAAIRAGRFVRTHFVDKVRHNGGIHDSIYAKPQLIDHESIYFCCRALLALYEVTKSEYFRAGAVRAAQLSASWVLLWDVPLPPKSTLACHGFRSTGWAGCDTPGAGYVHPMGIIATPDLVRVAQITGDTTFLDIAELCFMGSNENVGCKWGYALEGMQEEGLLLSPWFLDDPMFANDNGFGDRRKGEGNKTCLPWISAVTVWAGNELRKRFGTTDFAKLRQQIPL